jgi:hypothetical protein
MGGLELRAKLFALGLVFVLAMLAIASSASTALADEPGPHEGEEHEVPGSENGLVVAIGGIIGVYGFIGIILFMVMRKKKKPQPKA